MVQEKGSVENKVGIELLQWMTNLLIIFLKYFNNDLTFVTLMSYNKGMTLVSFFCQLNDTVVIIKGEEEINIMPTETFFNLDPNKQQVIFNAACDEFANNLFDQTSVAAIIERAGIPRGSFYQYFENLEDLYQYVMESIAQIRREYIRKKLPEMEGLDTFSLLRELYSVAISFTVNNPKLAAIGSNFFKEGRAFREKIYKELEEQAVEFMQRIIFRGCERGEIDKNVDPEVLSELLYLLNINMVDMFLKDYTRERDLVNLDGYLELVEKMLYIVEHGSKSK